MKYVWFELLEIVLALFVKRISFYFSLLKIIIVLLKVLMNSSFILKTYCRNILSSCSIPDIDRRN